MLAKRKIIRTRGCSQTATAVCYCDKRESDARFVVKPCAARSAILCEGCQQLNSQSASARGLPYALGPADYDLAYVAHWDWKTCCINTSIRVFMRPKRALLFVLDSQRRTFCSPRRRTDERAPRTAIGLQLWLSTAVPLSIRSGGWTSLVLNNSASVADTRTRRVTVSNRIRVLLSFLLSVLLGMRALTLQYPAVARFVSIWVTSSVVFIDQSQKPYGEQTFACTIESVNSAKKIRKRRANDCMQLRSNDVTEANFSQLHYTEEDMMPRNEGRTKWYEELKKETCE